MKQGILTPHQGWQSPEQATMQTFLDGVPDAAHASAWRRRADGALTQAASGQQQTIGGCRTSTAAFRTSRTTSARRPAMAPTNRPFSAVASAASPLRPASPRSARGTLPGDGAA